MNYRRLGSTGIEVSEIGFGTWGIGGDARGAVAYGPTDDAQSIAAIRRAYDLGVTFYDTADFYGHGHSERVLGEALRGIRKNVIIASKVGMLDNEGRQDFSPEHIRKSIEGSLGRLQTDTIDLYQLHSISIDELREDDRILSTMNALQESGKVRAIGISLRSPEEGPAAVHEFGFKAIQVNFSMVDQRALENRLFDLCEEEEVGLIVRTPLCFGFLTGAYSSKTHFQANDHRSRWPARQIERWAKAYTLFADGLQGYGSGNGTPTHAQVALSFCLSYGCVSTAIPGMLTSDQVEENAASSRMGPLADRERLKVQQIYQDHSFYVR
ncbi:MAG: aldo/keto reductase [Planctomycetota bacterium]|jgi:aryl-alcohol dehydrogenase-like predicted oxidoreductase|nr:aldo/keto reductase [Planctomycetota bacterium]